MTEIERKSKHHGLTQAILSWHKAYFSWGAKECHGTPDGFRRALENHGAQGTYTDEDLHAAFYAVRDKIKWSIWGGQFHVWPGAAQFSMFDKCCDETRPVEKIPGPSLGRVTLKVEDLIAALSSLAPEKPVSVFFNDDKAFVTYGEGINKAVLVGKASKS